MSYQMYVAEFSQIAPPPFKAIVTRNLFLNILDVPNESEIEDICVTARLVRFCCWLPCNEHIKRTWVVQHKGQTAHTLQIATFWKIYLYIYISH